MEAKNYIKSFLQTGIGTEGQLLIPRKIFDTIIGEVEKALIPRSEAAIVVGPEGIPGSSLDVDLDTVNTMDVREVGEGAEVPMDNSEYTSFNIKPAKYGVHIRITEELMEDSKWDLLQRQIATAGKRFAENENSLIVSDALDQASNTVAGGAQILISNITRGMQHLDDADYKPTTLFVGNEVLNDLRNIDTFVEANKIGNTEMLTRGFLGNIYGMNVIKVSTNAGYTTTSAYITDKTEAYMIVEKRPLSMKMNDVPSHDMRGVVLTQRLKVRQLRADAIAKITTT